MQVVLGTTGSFGDVFPLIGLGRALRSRGHDVVFVTSGDYGDRVKEAGLRFVEQMKAERHRDLMHSMGLGREQRTEEERNQWLGELGPRLHAVYAALEEAHRRGPTVFVGFGVELFAALAAHELLGVPFVRAYQVPEPLHRIRSTRFVNGRVRWALQYIWDRRFGWRARHFAREVRRFREDLGLSGAAASRLLPMCPPHLIYSPDLNIGLFPDWFVPWFSGFPPNTLMTAFPQYDGAGDVALSAEVEAFLSAGSPPVAFSVPTWKRNADAFFEESIRACRRIGRRAILLRSDVDATPPPGEDHFSVRFAPYSALMPRLAALVHGGTFGATGAALAAAVPQLCVPWAMEQPFSAWSVEQLGCGVVLPLSEYRAERVAELLAELTGSEAYGRRCSDYAARVKTATDLATACEAIEGLGGRARSLPPA